MFGMAAAYLLWEKNHCYYLISIYYYYTSDVYRL